MKNKALVISLFSLVVTLVVLAMIAITYAWFSKQLTITNNTYAVGEILYAETLLPEESIWISSTAPIVPNQDLIANDLILDNQSTIPSQLRLQITYSKYDIDHLVEPYTAYYSGINDHIVVSMPSEFVFSDDSGIGTETSFYWYYIDDEFDIIADSGLITFITSLYYSGDYASIDYANKPVAITITIQVKQANNVTWNDLTSYNFETGLPA